MMMINLVGCSINFSTIPDLDSCLPRMVNLVELMLKLGSKDSLLDAPN
jgi:hypothetical protein